MSDDKARESECSDDGADELGGGADGDEPKRLRGAQRRIADAYFGADAGLFVLNCVPGAGKSFCRSDIVARDLLRGWVAGDPTPEQHICMLTFNRAEAASMRSDVVERLRTVVNHDPSPYAPAITTDDLEALEHRVRRAPNVGTIDSFLRTILDDVAAAVGFDTMPDVGSDARLERVHKDCVAALRSTQAYADAFERLERAYPPRTYADGVGDLLRSMHEYRRRHRLTLDEFRTALLESVDAVYAEGSTTEIDDIAAAIARCVSEDAATDALEGLSEEQRRRVVATDRGLERRWRARIDDVCTLLEGYTEEYATRIRDRGVVSHLDCAFLVAEFLSSDEPAIPSVATDAYDDEHRVRVVERYRERVDAWVFDEAQDLSTVQHDALSPLVRPDSTVFAAGDLRQSIYCFRGSHPSLFATAIEDGTYLGVDWETHVVEAATQTYRCRPDVAAAIDAIAEPVLTDPCRGNLGDLDVSYPRLDPVRDPTQGSSVHVAAVDTNAWPGTPQYVSPERLNGEAEQLATYVAGKLADGTLLPEDDDCSCGRRTNTDEDGDADARGRACECNQPFVTVLFRRRKRMDTYAEAFDAQGLSVATASEPLFEARSVEVLCDVAAWLVDPHANERLQHLVEESALPLWECAAVFDDHDWDLDAVVENAPGRLDDSQLDRLTSLRSLRDRRGIRDMRSPTALADAIVDELALYPDPYDLTRSPSATQRVANLDAFREWLGDQTGDDHDGPGGQPARLVALTEPFRDDPYRGPRQPVAGEATADVVFETIHGMKGDEADVVALADLGASLWWPGTPNQRFLSDRSIAALAPPEGDGTDEGPIDLDIAALGNGLYGPPPSDSSGSTNGPPRDVGLRWATERWGSDEDGVTGLLGHDHLQTVTRSQRAESYRLLYVALTRAREHLVLPLPRTVAGGEKPRDRWIEPLRSGLEFDGTPPRGTYVVDGRSTGGGTSDRERGERESFEVSVNDITLTGNWSPGRSVQLAGSDGDTVRYTAATTPLDIDTLPRFVPRFVRPSTLPVLADAPDDWMLAHLLNEELHSRSSRVDPDLPIHGLAVPPEELGQVVHETLTTALRRSVSNEYSRSEVLELQPIAERLIDQQFPDITTSDRRKILQFVTDNVRSQVLESEWWADIESADRLYVEKPLPAKRQVDSLAFEFDGNADLVLERSDGSWDILELKIALGSLESETRDRYEQQVTTYEALLDDCVTGEIRTRLCILGTVEEMILLNIKKYTVYGPLESLVGSSGSC